MKTRLATIPLLMAMTALCACSSVRMSKPFPHSGEPPDKAKLEGVWQLDKTVLYLKFRDDGVGELNVPGWKDGKFQVDRGELIAVPGTDQNYLCLRMTSDGEGNPGYSFAAFKVDDANLLAWIPDTAEFERLIAAKKMEGSVETKENSKKILLSTAPETILEQLEGENGHKLMNYKNPLVLRRIAPAE